MIDDMIARQDSLFKREITRLLNDNKTSFINQYSVFKAIYGFNPSSAQLARKLVKIDADMHALGWRKAALH